MSCHQNALRCVILPPMLPPLWAVLEKERVPGLASCPLNRLTASINLFWKVPFPPLDSALSSCVLLTRHSRDGLHISGTPLWIVLRACLFPRYLFLHELISIAHVSFIFSGKVFGHVSPLRWVIINATSFRNKSTQLNSNICKFI
jgi:hypothetical protein